MIREAQLPTSATPVFPFACPATPTLLLISAWLAKASFSGLMQLKSRRNPKDMLEWPACHFLTRHTSPKLPANAVIGLLIAAPPSLQLKSSQKVEYARCLRETQASKGCKRKGPCDIKLYGRGVSVCENKLQSQGIHRSGKGAFSLDRKEQLRPAHAHALGS